MHLLVLSAFRLNENLGRTVKYSVSMHLLVLSAFRPYLLFSRKGTIFKSQCTFWCSVLSDSLYVWACRGSVVWSQCTFWCSVLSDWTRGLKRRSRLRSLNAPFGAQCFPTDQRHCGGVEADCLNAPFGAQCFPTGRPLRGLLEVPRLNAPFGAQCFPTGRSPRRGARRRSQCTFWCSVLSDSNGAAMTS